MKHYCEMERIIYRPGKDGPGVKCVLGGSPETRTMNIRFETYPIIPGQPSSLFSITLSDSVQKWLINQFQS